MKVKLLHTHKNECANIEPLIKRVAHVSYNKDGDLSEESSSKFIQKHILNAGHFSLLRHAWYTMRITPYQLQETFNYFSLPNHIRQYMVFSETDTEFFVSGTINMWYNLYKHLEYLPVPKALKIMAPTVFSGRESLCVEDAQIKSSNYAYTFLIEGCSRLFTHQQVRHNHNFAYNQESTRYVSYKDGFDFVMPAKMIGKHDINSESIESVALRKLEDDENFYSYLLSNGIKKEDARSFLPNGITSKIVVTVHHESLFGQYRLSRAEGKTGKPSAEIQSVAREMMRLAMEQM